MGVQQLFRHQRNFQSSEKYFAATSSDVEERSDKLLLFLHQIPWPKDHGQKLLSGNTIANEGMASASRKLHPR